MKLAERFGLPIVTLIDTPGAHDALVDEAAGLAGSISNCLTTMAAMTTPSKFTTPRPVGDRAAAPGTFRTKMMLASFIA